MKNLVALAALLAIITATDTAIADDSNTEKMRVANEMIHAWNTLDWETVFDLFAEDGILHTMTQEPVVGRENIRARLQFIVDDLERIELQIVNMGVVNDVVFMERVDDFDFHGKHSRVPVVGVLEISDGKVTEWREYYDKATLRKALTISDETGEE